jgi:hypothetical protein
MKNVAQSRSVRRPVLSLVPEPPPGPRYYFDVALDSPEGTTIRAVLLRGRRIDTSRDLPAIEAWLTRSVADAPDHVRTMVRSTLEVVRARIGSPVERGRLLRSVLQFVAEQCYPGTGA